ncbi:MAG: hypothetical protein JSV61_14815, partial [Anaerolineales bacterium]
VICSSRKNDGKPSCLLARIRLDSHRLNGFIRGFWFCGRVYVHPAAGNASHWAAKMVDIIIFRAII